MAGRPRLYANAAEKMRAHRQREEKRLVLVDRIWLEQTQRDLMRLWRAVDDARKRGDEIALPLDLRSKTDMLQNLALLFETGTTKLHPAQKTVEKGANYNSEVTPLENKNQSTTRREK